MTGHFGHAISNACRLFDFSIGLLRLGVVLVKPGQAVKLSDIGLRIVHT